ncbi:acyltransferase [Tardiphaga alba]|uniref:Acyltransferase n=2 Tax=Tardiphaga alba TaxID=340268 RepID=A0ABX8A6L5_9BRAD|nr:acyltransferase [Tardiphaga alba]
MVSVSFVATLVFDRGLVQRWMTAILSIRLFRGLGHLSYAMYVFHLPVLFYLGINDAAIGGGKVPILQVGLAFALTIGLAIASYYLLENPMAKLKQNFGGVKLVDPLAAPRTSQQSGGFLARFARTALTSPEDGQSLPGKQQTQRTIWPGIRRDEVK